MSGTFTFVHAADLHLDAPFRRVDVADPRVRDACVEATFTAFDRIVEICIDRGAAFLVIAGDAYNTAERSFRAQSRFRSAAERLGEAGIRVFLAGGNHDPVTAGNFALQMPDNVHVFSATTVERVDFPSADDPHCALYGRSFGRSRETANLAREFKKGATDPFAIGVLHANVGGDQDYEPYAPCSLEDLRASGMDYWALGHIHKHEVLTSEPPAVYPGSPQGLDPNEAGEHGCVVATVGSSGVTTEFVETAPIAWDRRTVDLSDASSLDDVIAELDSCCASVRAAAGDRPVLLRIDLVGRSEAHAALGGPSVFDELVAEVRADQSSADPWVWIDRVRDLTRPTLDLDRIRAGADFASDLTRLVDEIGPDEAAEVLEEVLAPLRASARGVGLGDIDATSVLERARDACLDRLVAGEGER